MRYWLSELPDSSCPDTYCGGRTLFFSTFKQYHADHIFQILWKTNSYFERYRLSVLSDSFGQLRTTCPDSWIYICPRHIHSRILVYNISHVFIGFLARNCLNYILSFSDTSDTVSRTVVDRFSPDNIFCNLDIVFYIHYKFWINRTKIVPTAAEIHSDTNRTRNKTCKSHENGHFLEKVQLSDTVARTIHVRFWSGHF